MMKLWILIGFLFALPVVAAECVTVNGKTYCEKSTTSQPEPQSVPQFTPHCGDGGTLRFDGVRYYCDFPDTPIYQPYARQYYPYYPNCLQPWYAPAFQANVIITYQRTIRR